MKLPWRENTCEISESNINNLDNGEWHHLKQFSRQDQAKGFQNTAHLYSDVITGIVRVTIHYIDEKLVVKNIICEDLFPWEYKWNTNSHVTVQLPSTMTQDIQRSEVQTGVHMVYYEHNFVFNLRKSDLQTTQLNLTVWKTGSETTKETEIGQCMIVMDRDEMMKATDYVVMKKFLKTTVRAI